MKRATVGELEELILLIIAVIRENAYGVNITHALEKQVGRRVDFSTVHTTLKRLEEKGLLKSTMGGATAERGGRRKRYFTVTAFGMRALRESQEVRTRLWSMIRLNVEPSRI